jgi:hypothetical protein
MMGKKDCGSVFIYIDGIQIKYFQETLDPDLDP